MHRLEKALENNSEAVSLLPQITAHKKALSKENADITHECQEVITFLETSTKAKQYAPSTFGSRNNNKNTVRGALNTALTSAQQIRGALPNVTLGTTFLGGNIQEGSSASKFHRKTN